MVIDYHSFMRKIEVNDCYCLQCGYTDYSLVNAVFISQNGTWIYQGSTS